MPISIIGTEAGKRPALCSELEQVTFNSVRKILPDAAIEGACRDAGYTYRRRTLTPIVTVLHMILASIWPEESFQASLHLLWDHFTGVCPGLAGKAPTSGSLAKARARLPLGMWKRIVAYLADKAEALSESFAVWRGHRVVLADGTCVSMPDTPSLHEHFGSSTGHGGKRVYPLGRMVSLALANTMTVLTYALGRYRDSEQSLLRPLLKRLRHSDLLLADRHFAGANLYAEYLALGLHFLTRAHQRLKISRLRRLWEYGPDDFVADLPVNKNHRRKNPNLLATVRVRLIRATVRTRGRRETMWFVTSLLDAATYPAREIVELYARRWRIETVFLQLKRRLSADVLRSKTPDGVRKELAACVAALNIVRAIMLEAAVRHGRNPMRLSFVGTVRAILAFAPLLADAPPWKLLDIYEAMLFQIALSHVPDRPGRQEPHAVRREGKHYPRLRVTRKEWKQRWAA
jgi:hypothetical protein